MRRQAKCYNLITRMLSGHWARGEVGGEVGGEGGEKGGVEGGHTQSRSHDLHGL